MVDANYTKKLQSLSFDYYNQLISREEYLAQRKEILDSLDAEYNGVGKIQSPEDETESSSLLMDTVSFFKGKISQNDES